MAALVQKIATHFWYKNGTLIWASTKKEAEEFAGVEIDNTWIHSTKGIGITNQPVTHRFQGFFTGFSKSFDADVNASNDKEALDFIQDTFPFVTLTYAVRVSDGQSID